MTVQGRRYKSERHRFNYSGDLPSEGLFNPRAVCIDVRGRILLIHLYYDCYRASETCICLLDQDGNIFIQLLNDDLHFKICTVLFVDENNMYVGW